MTFEIIAVVLHKVIQDKFSHITVEPLVLTKMLINT